MSTSGTRSRCRARAKLKVGLKKLACLRSVVNFLQEFCIRNLVARTRTIAAYANLPNQGPRTNCETGLKAIFSIAQDFFHNVQKYPQKMSKSKLRGAVGYTCYTRPSLQCTSLSSLKPGKVSNEQVAAHLSLVPVVHHCLPGILFTCWLQPYATTVGCHTQLSALTVLT